jgi:hypothetical protein
MVDVGWLKTSVGCSVKEGAPRRPADRWPMHRRPRRLPRTHVIVRGFKGEADAAKQPGVPVLDLGVFLAPRDPRDPRAHERASGTRLLQEAVEMNIVLVRM